MLNETTNLGHGSAMRVNRKAYKCGLLVCFSSGAVFPEAIREKPELFEDLSFLAEALYLLMQLC